MRYWLFTLMLAFAACVAAEQESTLGISHRSADAYTFPYRGLNGSQSLKKLQEGRSLFRQIWTVEGGEDRRFSGLGPLYNRFSCIACHPGNGRGFAPNGPGESMKTMLVRLSVHDPQKGFIPHQLYGDQLNEFSMPGMPSEGIASVNYTPLKLTFADGEEVTLRQPTLSFSELAHGPLNEVFTSARIAPAVFGLGLLDNVSDEEIIHQTQRPKPKGIAGRPNMVWDIKTQKLKVGKFGWKANTSSLRQQIASAFHGDLGLTSSLFPYQNCPPTPTGCLSATDGYAPELSDSQLEDIQFYLEALAVPEQAPPTEAINRGAVLFKNAQCIECHTDQLRTGQQASIGFLNHRTIKPYTDLLLHDMGEGLADQRPDFAATGREWRTPPLWGIGLAKKVHSEAGFLHDGRARTLQEAILWHGGEATIARDRYIQFTKKERELILMFLESL